MLCIGGVCLPLLPFLLLFIQPVLNLLPRWITDPIKAFFAAIFPFWKTEKSAHIHNSEFLKDLTSAEQLKAADLAFVKFGASWCPPCRRIAPYFAALAEEFHASAAFLACDVDAHPEFASDVRSIPAFAVFRRGERTGPLFVGADQPKLRDFVTENLKKTN